MVITHRHPTESTAQQRMLDGSAAPDFWNRLTNGGAFSRNLGYISSRCRRGWSRCCRRPSGGAISLGMKVVAPGMMVMAIIYFMGTVRGAHLNPAVTLAFAARRNFPWPRVPGYLGAQFVGGVAAAAFLRAMFGTQGLLGATTPGRAWAISRLSSWRCY